MAKVKSGVCQVAGRAKRESPLVRLPRRDNRAVSQRLSNLSAAHGERGGTGRKKKRKGEGSYRQHGISLSFSMENVAQ